MAGGIPWREEEDALLREHYPAGGPDACEPLLPGRSRGTIKSRASQLKIKYVGCEVQPKPLHREAEERDPTLTELQARIKSLEAENARLSEQLTWAQHGIATERTGGRLTIRRSDEHCADKQHMLASLAQCEEKLLVLVEQYQPDEIVLAWGDDIVAGRGIYKEQDLDSATSSPDEQIMVGAWKMRRFLERLREKSSAVVYSEVFNGNHNYAGSTPMTPGLFFTARALCEDLPDVKWRLCGDRALINLAFEGTHNALVTHGFGHSKVSPNSGAFIDAMKDVLIQMARNLEKHEQPRRIVSGHTHWLSLGMERINELYWDTTGGFQRNTRVKLGMNQRPSGMAVYVSLPGMKDEILKPIEVKPNPETYLAEIESPTLVSENLRDVGESITAAKELMQERGLLGKDGIGGVVMQGRW